MRYFWDAWPSLKARLAGRKKLLIVDLDGTLASIAPRPEDVRVPQIVLAHLDALCRRKDYRVAVSSGRSLKDLKRLVSLPKALYMGSHGLEMDGPGLSTPPEARRARELRFLMSVLAEKLANDLFFVPGVLVEDKGLGVSLHFRRLSKDFKPAFHEVTRFFQENYRDHPLVWKKGKKAWEILPKVKWHKGFAAAHLLELHRDDFPVVVGDGGTDEDMFRAMRGRGATIRVGRSRGSSAEYYLRSQKQVDSLLEEFIHETS